MKEEEIKIPNTRNIFISSLISGGMAGTFVDIALFPLDTLKTRLQSQNGFIKSGGFSGLYKGVGPVIIGSAPTAALFFVTYDTIKGLLQPDIPEQYHSLLHMGAASFGELVACLIRVPVEVTKQRKQALVTDKGRLGIKLLYRGYWSTVMRDMPFSLIQFPLWEYFKSIRRHQVDRELESIEGAIAGAISGGIAAAVTTPLDVAKTRIMLADKTIHSLELKISHMLKVVYRKNGLRGLFAGFGPRVTWITVGGFIFFGVYEQTKIFATNIFPVTTLVPR